MDLGLISVLLIGNKTSADNLILPDIPVYETDRFSVLQLENDSQIAYELASHHFNVICTFGDVSDYPNLGSQPLSVRKQWLHYDDSQINLALVAEDIMGAYLSSVTEKRFPETPLVSVFTPTYMTGTGLLRPYQSLCQQSYDNWEWVIYDDSLDDATFKIASSLADADHRIKVFKSSKRHFRRAAFELGYAESPLLQSVASPLVTDRIDTRP